MGFLCYVCGKTDPSEFFFGMRLTFDGAPHLVQLKTAIEQRAVQDNACPDGSRYIITDLEILDMRLNMWTPLDTRAQLYSGCHVAAVRDSGSATSAGPVDVAHKLPQQRALGFALDAESAFRALDVENRGLVSLTNALHVFRHDLNFAVDFFTMVDVRNCGQVTMQDLMAATKAKRADFWKELQLRISRGGLDPGLNTGGDFSAVTGTPRSGAATPVATSSVRGGATPGGASALSAPGTPRAATPASVGSGGAGLTPGAGAGAGAGGAAVKRQGIAAGILAAARQQKAEEEKRHGPPSAASADTMSARSGQTGASDGPAAAAGEGKDVASARRIVEMFQKASSPKKPAGYVGVQGAMAKMKESVKKTGAAGGGGAGGVGTSPSIAGSNSTQNSPSASSRPRK